MGISDWEKLSTGPTKFPCRPRPSGSCCRRATSGPPRVPMSHDVFLSYNSSDRPAARLVKDILAARGLTVFIDERELAPGQNFIPGLEAALLGCKSVAILMGPSGLGKWQQIEKDLALDRKAKEPSLPVVPVLLPGKVDPIWNEPAWLESTRRTDSVSTTCTGTCGSGAWTVMAVTTWDSGRIRIPGRPRSGCSGAAAGATSPGTAGPRTATGARRSAATTAWGSAQSLPRPASSGGGLAGA